MAFISTSKIFIWDLNLGTMTSCCLSYNLPLDYFFSLDDPGCVYTCSGFPNIPKMKKVSNLPVLAGRNVEYVCRNNKKVPHTGERFFLDCLDNGENGKFIGEVADDVTYLLDTHFGSTMCSYRVVQFR